MTMQKKRSLILAGGGIKVAFQAGAMQVWLDEAGLTFDHVDAASGGVFNLAMLCQGMSGSEIAENWRRTNPRKGVDFNVRELAKLFFADSIATMDEYREHVFADWGLDWSKIRASKLDATFNVYNFSKHDLEVITPRDMTEDLLVACVSLPMWFPPVHVGDDLYLDSVYLTDANLEEAIRRGADELWVIWTVSDKSEWHGGFLAQYFQIIEIASVGRYRAVLKRIAENNAKVARGEHSEFGRHIEVKELKADVPMHYLINLSQDRVTEAVNLGVQRARQWCQGNGIPLASPAGEFSTDVHTVETKLQFTEKMKGYVTFGEVDCERGYKEGKKLQTSIMFKLTIIVEGVNRFVTRPEHDARAEGYVECDALGGRLNVEKGMFNLFVDQEDSAVKKMFYRLFFRDSQGRALTLSGHKLIRDDPGFDIWSDTTTLFTRILKGHVTAEEEAAAEKAPAKYEEMVVASGIIIIHLLDFMQQLTTFRVEGPTVVDRAAAMTRFGKLFLGKLWDAYARGILTSGPF
jgi:predicted acylesterase/phospholipase RssA